MPKIFVVLIADGLAFSSKQAINPFKIYPIKVFMAPLRDAVIVKEHCV